MAFCKELVALDFWSTEVLMSDLQITGSLWKLTSKLFSERMANDPPSLLSVTVKIHFVLIYFR